MTVAYSSDARVEWSNAKRCWVVLEPFNVRWTDDEGNVLADFTVEKGFETDGPSIPRRLQGIVSKYGNQFQPSIAHDWCYKHVVGTMTRRQADKLFLEGMAQLDVPWLRRNVMYAATRIGGEGRWK